MNDYPLILLCGGKSSRMGSPKGLLEINGRPWFLEHLRQFQKAGGTHAVIVLGYHAEAYANQISWIEDIHNDQWVAHDGLLIAITINKKPELGQFSSLLCGFRRLEKETLPGAFVMPVDILPPLKATWLALTNMMSDKIDVCIPVYREKKGHPVLLSVDFINTMLKTVNDPGNARLDHEIKKLPAGSVKHVVTSDKRISGNVNTPDDFEDLIQS